MSGDPAAPPAAPVGVNLVGYLDAPTGIGEIARRAGVALRSAGVHVTEVRVSSRAAGGAVPPRQAALHPANLVCINPDGMAGAEAELGRDFFSERHTIGYWWWELDSFPQAWPMPFDLVDEVWVGSRYVAQALAPAAPVPVLEMPVPVPEPPPAGPIALDLPNGFKFLSVYDYRNVPARKNPLGAIEAFASAFAGEDGVHLILKSLGAEDDPAAHAAVLDAARPHANVHVVNRVMSSAETDALVGACDAYVSLHRAEGFGLPLAQAMRAGKPVIATAYGGPADFLTEHNSYPVSYELVPIGEGRYPYPAAGSWAEPDLAQARARMRQIVDDRAGSAARGAAAARELAERYSPARAGAAMAARLRLGRSAVGSGRGSSSSDVARVMETLPRPAPGRSLEGPRSFIRRALWRALKPYDVHRRQIDAELLRALRTLEARTAEIERGLAVVRAEARTHDGDEPRTTSPA